MTKRPSRPGAPPTSDQVRDQIDRGGADDKVPFSDPAASPLGSDDEAGGAPPTAEQRAAAHRQEAGSGGAPRESSRPEELQAFPYRSVVVAVVVVVVVALAMIWLIGGWGR
jgi:hypothetical protein